MAIKKKTIENSDEVKVAAADFTMLANNNYTIAIAVDAMGDVAYGSTVTVAGSAEAYNIDPAYGLSAIRVQTLAVSGSNSIPLVLSASRVIPASITWDGAIGELINFTVSANNQGLHASAISGTFVVYASGYGILSGGSTGTVQNGTSLGSDISFVALGDVGAPSGISAFTATTGSMIIDLTWAYPVDSDLVSINIRKSLTTPITSVTEGSLIYSGLLTSYSDNDFANESAGSWIQYGAYSIDNVGKASTISTLSATMDFHGWVNAYEHARLYIQGII